MSTTAGGARPAHGLYDVAAAIVYGLGAIVHLLFAALLMTLGSGWLAGASLVGGFVLAASLGLHRQGCDRAALLVAAAEAAVMVALSIPQMGSGGAGSFVACGLLLLVFQEGRLGRTTRVLAAGGFLGVMLAALTLAGRSLAGPAQTAGSIASHPLYFVAEWLLVAVGGSLFGAATLRTFAAHQRQVTALRESSRSDPLTGLLDHRAMTAAITAEIARSSRGGSRFVILMVDLDELVDFSQHHGAACGDWVLVTLANLLRRITRAQDVVGRWHGGSLLLLLPETDLEGGTAAARRLRGEVERGAFVYDGREVSFTVSVGLSSGDGDTTATGCIEALAAATHLAKSSGPNAVAIYPLNGAPHLLEL